MIITLNTHNCLYKCNIKTTPDTIFSNDASKTLSNRRQCLVTSQTLMPINPDENTVGPWPDLVNVTSLWRRDSGEQSGEPIKV